MVAAAPPARPPIFALMHIPKAGGTTVSHILAGMLGGVPSMCLGAHHTNTFNTPDSHPEAYKHDPPGRLPMKHPCASGRASALRCVTLSSDWATCRYFVAHNDLPFFLALQERVRRDFGRDIVLLAHFLHPFDHILGKYRQQFHYGRTEQGYPISTTKWLTQPRHRNEQIRWLTGSADAADDAVAALENGTVAAFALMRVPLQLDLSICVFCSLLLGAYDGTIAHNVSTDGSIVLRHLDGQRLDQVQPSFSAKERAFIQGYDRVEIQFYKTAERVWMRTTRMHCQSMPPACMVDGRACTALCSAVEAGSANVA